LFSFSFLSARVAAAAAAAPGFGTIGSFVVRPLVRRRDLMWFFRPA
jgi:hypothetical protein